MADLVDLIEEVGERFDRYKAEQDTRLDELEKLIGRQRLFGGGTRETTNGLGGSAEEQRAVSRYLRSGDEIEIRSMSVGDDSQGGYAVEAVLAPSIQRVMREVSPIHGLVRTVTTRSDRFKELWDRGAVAAGTGWVGETQVRPVTSNPTLGMIDIPVREIYAMPELTQQLLDDNSFNVEGWLADCVGEAFAEQEATAIWNGTTPNRPMGIFSWSATAQDDASRPWGAWQYIPTGVDGNFNLSSQTGVEVFIDAVAAIRSQYRARATWVMNRATFAKVCKLKDADYKPVVADLVNGSPMRIMGFPVILDENMPSISNGSLSVAFGDLQRAYTLVERQGVRVLRDSLTNKPFVRFYTTRRVGGNPVDSLSLKFIKFSAS